MEGWEQEVAGRLGCVPPHAVALASFLATAADANNATASRGCVVSGAPGSGKSAVVAAVLATWPCVCTVMCEDLFVSELGGSEQALEDRFEALLRSVQQHRQAHAQSHAVGVLVLEGVEGIARRNSGGVEARMKATLKHLLAKVTALFPHTIIVTIGVSSAVEQVDPALRQFGRLHTLVDVNAPDLPHRKAIAQQYLQSIPLECDLEEAVALVAHDTVGFLPADIAGVWQELHLQQSKGDQAEPVSLGRLRKALDACAPSVLREDFKWQQGQSLDNLAGLDSAVADLKLYIVRPLRGEGVHRSGTSAPRGVLVHGPSATGKTLLVHALAASLRGVANFIEVQPSNVLSKIVGESEANLARLFKTARQCAPCVLFLDQLDLLAPVRGEDTTSQLFDRILSLLLVELDGIFGGHAAHAQVVVVGATRELRLCDPAILRAGRFDRHVALHLPDRQARLDILAQALRSTPNALTAADVAWVADQTSGCSAADLVNFCREAALAALREDIQSEQVRMAHLRAALKAALSPPQSQ